MDFASLVPLVIKASVIIALFALGLQVTLEDVLSLRHRPRQLLRSLLAMHVIMPVVAVALALAMDLNPAVEIALIGLAISPVPPALAGRQTKAGGSPPYSFSLLVVVGLFSIVYVPLALEAIGRIFGVSVDLPPAEVAMLILNRVLLPLGGGLALRHFAPAFAKRIGKPLSLIATLSLYAVALPMLFTLRMAMFSLIGNGTLLAFLTFIVVGLAAGHLLGGPDPADRTVLAIAVSSRHPAIALAIARANFPEAKLVLPAIVLYMVMNMIVAISHSKWRRSKV